MQEQLLEAQDETTIPWDNLGAQALRLRHRGEDVHYNDYLTNFHGGSRSDRVLLISSDVAQRYYQRPQDNGFSHLLIHEWKINNETAKRYSIPVVHTEDPGGSLEESLLLELINTGRIDLTGDEDTDLTIVRSYQRLYERLFLAALREGGYIPPVDFEACFRSGGVNSLDIPAPVAVKHSVQKNRLVGFLDETINGQPWDEVMGADQLAIKTLLSRFIASGETEVPREIFSEWTGIESAADVQQYSDSVTTLLCFNQFYIDVRYDQASDLVKLSAWQYPRTELTPPESNVKIGLYRDLNLEDMDASGATKEEVDGKYSERSDLIRLGLELSGINDILRVGGAESILLANAIIEDTEIIVFPQTLGDTQELLVETLAKAIQIEHELTGNGPDGSGLIDKHLLRYRKHVVIFRQNGNECIVELTDSQLEILQLFMRHGLRELPLEIVKTEYGDKSVYTPPNRLLALSRVYREYGFRADIGSREISSKNGRTVIGYRLPMVDFSENGTHEQEESDKDDPFWVFGEDEEDDDDLEHLDDSEAYI